MWRLAKAQRLYRQALPDFLAFCGEKPSTTYPADSPEARRPGTSAQYACFFGFVQNFHFSAELSEPAPPRRLPQLLCTLRSSWGQREILVLRVSALPVKCEEAPEGHNQKCVGVTGAA